VFYQRRISVGFRRLGGAAPSPLRLLRTAAAGAVIVVVV
jgi:hypothetical protein